MSKRDACYPRLNSVNKGSDIMPPSSLRSNICTKLFLAFKLSNKSHRRRGTEDEKPSDCPSITSVKRWQAVCLQSSAIWNEGG